MSRRRRKGPREKDLTGRYLGGDFDPDRIDSAERFGDRSKHAEIRRIERTAALRADAAGEDADRLPLGQVIQVYSLFADVKTPDGIFRCTMRKTLSRLRDSGIVVGDQVRFQPTGRFDEAGMPEASVEAVLPRVTVLARADSFKGVQSHAIVANAQQMLIVIAVIQPRIKWGLVDRMLIAARAGSLTPLICLNKVDLAHEPDAQHQADLALKALAHYQSLGIRTLQTSARTGEGLDELRGILKDRSTVLAGHSGVGKSSLLRAIQPAFDIRVGDVSATTGKGRHTTTSARRYPLDFGGEVIDTPGVRQFALWNVTHDNLIDHYPDIQADTAPKWRQTSYQRISESLMT